MLANGSMSSNQSNEGEIRKNIIEADLVDCIIALPGQLFRSTQIPACLWFLRRGRRQRRGETLFIDARKLGYMADRTHRDLSEDDIASIADTYHAWRETRKPIRTMPTSPDSARAPRWTRSGTTATLLTPGRHVGAAPLEDDGEPFQEKMTRLAAQWREQQEEARRLDAAIAENLAKLGFDQG